MLVLSQPEAFNAIDFLQYVKGTQDFSQLLCFSSNVQPWDLDSKSSE